MNRELKIAFLRVLCNSVAMIGLLALIILIIISGCVEADVAIAEPKLPVWGQGELPAEWQEYFGNDNVARLNFMQTRALDRMQAIIYGIDVSDPNGQPMRKRGLIERITKLEGLIGNASED